MSLFRKPKRNVRQRQADDDDADDVDAQVEEDPGLRELQSSIAKFKEKKASKSDKKKSVKKTFDDDDKEDKKAAAQLLSFDEDLLTGDDGEVFRVKKSSQSRRLMKQKKAEKKQQRGKFGQNEFDQNSNGGDNDADSGSDLNRVIPLPDLEIKVRDTIPRKEAPTSWTLTGKEAEALHFEEEDEEEEETDQDPLQKLLKSGAIPDAAAIHAARKQRQAARDGGVTAQSGASYIPIKKKNSAHNSADDESADEDDDNVRIKFAGIKSGKRPDMGNGRDETEEEEHGWEEQQIRKAVKNTGPVGFNTESLLAPPPPPNISMTPSEMFPKYDSDILPQAHTNITYNLEGIKGRLKQRLTSLNEVHRRHESDLDKVVDDLIGSQSEIETLESRIPDLAERHRFFQDLRGYVTDLVECFNEKVVNIKYLEDKLTKVKGDMTKKLMERRREDVRDQMKELSGAQQMQQQPSNPAEMAEESARQRRSAERDGRRRRRLQFRAASQNTMKVQHYEGMSSDDEISSLDQANLGKSRSEIESQARQIMADVVEDFSTLEGVKQRFEAWKEEDPDSYSDAFVSLCLPKIVSPLIRLQLLFWNPLTEHSNIESMEWYTSLASYSLPQGKSDLSELERDPDRRLLTLVVEKVLLVKISGLVGSAYDPMSTTQTLKLTGTLARLIDNYPTLTGESKQVRDLLTVVKDRLKMSLDQDVYIPLGYPKQLLENPSSGHSKFLSRQFWGAFKLFKNILCWHGLLADKILVELAINALLCRYLVIGLTITPDPNDVLTKCRFITAVLPSEWIKAGLYQNELKRFTQFLVNLAQTAKQGPDFVREVSQLVLFLGEKEECAKLNKNLKV